MNIVAEKCLRYRAEHDLSQQKMAELCGLERTTIVKVENGGSVSKLTAYKILRIASERTRRRLADED